ncbi:hypothetical protein [Phenylobacterium sp.]|uniref:hypothetical protein n=1 Tax=Phenylobacterium sp. TaxID=1871053 RepID=UPI0035ADB869
MATMPRGEPRSVPDAAGDAYDAMIKSIRRLAQGDTDLSDGDDTGYYRLGLEWLTGLGPRRHEFGQNDPATKILRGHEHIATLRKHIADSTLEVGKTYHDNFSLGGRQGVPKFAKVYSAVPTGGRVGNLAAAYLGSYPLEYRVLSVNKDGSKAVAFKVANQSTLESATRPPVLGYTGPYKEIVGPALNSLVPTGPLSKTSQTFEWTETIPAGK